MRKSWLGLGLAVVSLVTGLRAEAAGPKQQKVVVGYILSGGRPLDIKTVAAGKMTRINYAFFRLKGNAIADATPRDEANLAALTGLKKDHPGLAVLISVGGGGGSGGFSDM